MSSRFCVADVPPQTGRVLFVDDEWHSLSILAKRLGVRGLDVSVVHGLGEGVDAVTATDFDVVVLNTNAWSREHEQAVLTMEARMPGWSRLIILLATLPRDCARARAFLNDHDCLLKPVDALALMDHIENP